MPKAKRPARLSLSEMWRGFKLCPTGLHDDGFTKWEATCYREEHKEATACRRTLGFSTPEQQQITLRRLKFWCVSGRSCTSRQAHKELPYYPQPLPTDEELEHLPL